MDVGDENLNQLVKALPGHFQFYDYGEVNLQPIPCQFVEPIAFAYRFYGDLSAVFILIFEKDLDTSFYSEMGNIIASKIATNLNLLVSPPQMMSEIQLNHLIKNRKYGLQRTYAHFFNNSVIPLETLVLPATWEGVGYA